MGIPSLRTVLCHNAENTISSFLTREQNYSIWVYRLEVWLYPERKFAWRNGRTKGLFNTHLLIEHLLFAMLYSRCFKCIRQLYPQQPCEAFTSLPISLMWKQVHDLAKCMQLVRVGGPHSAFRVWALSHYMLLANNRTADSPEGHLSVLWLSQSFNSAQP